MQPVILKKHGSRELSRTRIKSQIKIWADDGQPRP